MHDDIFIFRGGPLFFSGKLGWAITLGRLVICALQKILQMEWLATMVDCGLLNKQHYVRRTVCWTQAP